MARHPFFRRTFRLTRHQSDPARDVRDEIELHLDLRAQELIDGGMAPAAARREAARAFGDRRRIAAECRSLAEPMERRRHRLDALLALAGDLRLALRDLTQRPTFAAVAVLTLALAIGLAALVFTVVHGLLLEPLPYPGAERIVILFNSYPQAGDSRSENSAPDYFDRRQLDAFEAVALVQAQSATIGDAEAPQRVFSQRVTPSFFQVFAVEPQLGRTFAEAESEPGRNRTVVLSHRLWQERFAGRGDVLEQELRVEGVVHRVVGVMPESFSFPTWDTEIWQPMAFSERETSADFRHRNNYQMLARLRPGVSLDTARDQLDALNAAVTESLPPEARNLVVEAGFHTQIHGYQDDLMRHVRPWLYLLWAGALVVLGIGAVSLSNLFLVRAQGRLRELATRFVLGASRGRLVRQLVTESLAVATVGGTLGVLVATWALRWLDAFEVYEIPRIDEVRLEPAIAGAAVATSILMGALASLLAVMAVHRRDLHGVLRAGAATAGGRAQSLRAALVAVQIALAVVLLLGTGLMAASLRNVLAIDPGFEPRGVLAGAVSPPWERYGDTASRQRFFHTVLEEVRGLPGVEGAGAVSQLPFSGLSSRQPVRPEGDADTDIATHYLSTVTPAYFAALEIPILRGRDFREDDGPAAPAAVIVSERVAELHWPGEDPLGRRLTLDGPPGRDAVWRTVVGVVGDVVQNDLAGDIPRGGIYLPYGQNTLGYARLVVKTTASSAASPRSQLGAVRERLAAIDPEVVLHWVVTLEESVAASLIPRRIPLRLLAVFAGVALFLAAVGVYGVVAQSVSQRTKEIGIRLALGSSRDQIFRLVFRRLAALVAVGLAIGLAVALSISHLLSRLLFEVSATDPAVLGLVIGTLLLSALAASFVPVRHATRVDPTTALSVD